MAEDKKALRCSFCGKPESQVHRMIQGPGVRICDECVQLCMDILNDGYTTAADGIDSMDELPTPKEIHDVLDQYERHPAIRGHRCEKTLERFQAPGRCTDPDDQE